MGEKWAIACPWACAVGLLVGVALAMPASAQPIADDSMVAGNTEALNAMDGIQLRGATGAFIDHNTIANNGGSGLNIYANSSSDLCLRNNNITGNAEFALDAAGSAAFDVTSACTAPLSSGPAYGNNAFNNTSGTCGGSECNECACLPPGSFWEYSADPFYPSITVGDANLYCLGASSALIDAGADLAYDLNGPAPGNFNQSSPDIGSLENGQPHCK